MKSNLKKSLAILLAVVFTFVNAGLAVYAGGQLKEIKAYVNEGITIKVDRMQQNMKDADRKRLYPISYNGSTYVPIRAVGQMFGKQVKWDGTTQTVLIGDSGSAGAIDFIDDIEPYDSESGFFGGVNIFNIKFSGTTTEIAGKMYDNCIKSIGSGKLYYNLEGKYKKITFQAYNADDSGNKTIVFLGDNDTALKTVEVEGKELPKTYTVDVTGVKRMVLSMEGSYTYLFNATIE